MIIHVAWCKLNFYAVKMRCLLVLFYFNFSNKLSREKQNEFLIELLTPIREIWLSDEMQM